MGVYTLDRMKTSNMTRMNPPGLPAYLRRSGGRRRPPRTGGGPRRRGGRRKCGRRRGGRRRRTCFNIHSCIYIRLCVLFYLSPLIFIFVFYIHTYPINPPPRTYRAAACAAASPPTLSPCTPTRLTPSSSRTIRTRASMSRRRRVGVGAPICVFTLFLCRVYISWMGVVGVVCVYTYMSGWVDDDSGGRM